MKTQRNAPCPCGSGKKYKKCCAQLGSTAGNKETVGASIDRSIYKLNKIKNKISTASRACGDCAACCQGWLTTNALGHDIYLNHPCPHSNGHGCTIHTERPEDPCKLFFCAWATVDSDLPHWMQPNQSGVIVLSNRMHWQKMPVDILVSTENDPNEKLIHWFQERCHQQGIMFVYQKNEQWFGYGPEQFQLDMAEKISRGEALWDGSLIGMAR